MKLTKNLGMLLLAIWLIVTGLLVVFSVLVPGSATMVPAISIILAILAIAAGVLILLGR
jgi:hypothetical protein